MRSVRCFLTGTAKNPKQDQGSFQACEEKCGLIVSVSELLRVTPHKGGQQHFASVTPR